MKRRRRRGRCASSSSSTACGDCLVLLHRHTHTHTMALSFSPSPFLPSSRVYVCSAILVMKNNLAGRIPPRPVQMYFASNINRSHYFWKIAFFPIPIPSRWNKQIRAFIYSLVFIYFFIIITKARDHQGEPTAAAAALTINRSSGSQPAGNRLLLTIIIYTEHSDFEKVFFSFHNADYCLCQKKRKKKKRQSSVVFPS